MSNTSDTPQLSPIEKAIEELEEQIEWVKKDRCFYSEEEKPTVINVLTNLLFKYKNNLLPYERQYLRDVAEKAWGQCHESFNDNIVTENGMYSGIEYNLIEEDKQTYLNQNHPL